MADYINVTSLNRLAKQVLGAVRAAERSDRLRRDFRFCAPLQKRPSVLYLKG